MSPLLLILRTASLVWALIACPPAALLLFVCSTRSGSLFAIAALLIGFAPFLVFARPRSRLLRSAGLFALAGWAVITAWLFQNSPNGVSRPDARVQNRSATGRWHYPRYALGALLPEVDQYLLGFQLVPLVDRLFTRQQARQLSQLTRTLYGELEADPDFHALGSVMPDVYRELWGGNFDRGHYFLYIPPHLDRRRPAPALVLLHGSGGNFKAYTWVLSRLADLRGMILIAPSYGIGNWDGENSSRVVTEALDDAARITAIDQTQVHLAGLSNGGLGVSQIAASSAGPRFRSLIFLSPVFDEPAISSDSFAAQWRGKPALIVTGEKDNRIPLDYVRTCLRTMSGAHVQTSLVTYPDANHFLIFSHRAALLQQLGSWLDDQKQGTGQPSP